VLYEYITENGEERGERRKSVSGQNSSVDIAIGYGLDGRADSLSPGRVKNFFFSKQSRPALEPTQSHI
jgi:hypothetical protein